VLSSCSYETGRGRFQDTLRYAEGSDGVEVHVWDGMLHVFPSSAGILDAADAALDSIGQFIASHMTSASSRERTENEAARR
jgi:acetyl esterase/lipase